MKRKTRAIRTIADLQSALLLLIGGDGRAEGKKHTVETCNGRTRSTMTFFVGDLYWRLDESRGGPLAVHESGDSPADAYRNCCLRLQEELEERARQRRVTAAAQPAAVLTHRPLRITYQPTEAT